MTQAAMTKTDAQIHHDVLEELKWDSRVDETEVGVQVASGVVTLTGSVTSWAKRVAAQCGVTVPQTVPIRNASRALRALANAPRTVVSKR